MHCLPVHAYPPRVRAHEAIRQQKFPPRVCAREERKKIGKNLSQVELWFFGPMKLFLVNDVTHPGWWPIQTKAPPTLMVPWPAVHIVLKGIPCTLRLRCFCTLRLRCFCPPALTVLKGIPCYAWINRPGCAGDGLVMGWWFISTWTDVFSLMQVTCNKQLPLGFGIAKHCLLGVPGV